MIEEIRKKINSLDKEILDLLNRRAKLAMSIGEEKEERDIPVEDKSREEEVLGRLGELNEGPLSDKSVRRVFEVIIEEVKELEREVMDFDRGNETAGQRKADPRGRR